MFQIRFFFYDNNIKLFYRIVSMNNILTNYACEVSIYYLNDNYRKWSLLHTMFVNFAYNV